jgi:hypothetical protein
MSNYMVCLTSRIAKKHELPNHIIAEITITNVSNYHEGRIDEILEYIGNQYGVCRPKDT